jgi:carboxymethylenebutenolidase
MTSAPEGNGNMTNLVDSPDLTLNQQAMLTAWQQHTYAEFALKDPDAAVAVMTEDPHLFLIPSGTGGVGRAAVYKFYAEQMLPHLRTLNSSPYLRSSAPIE